MTTGRTGVASNTNRVESIPLSADSTLEKKFFTVNNTMTLRIPSAQLDTVLKSIAPLVEYLDLRLVKADDIALQLLKNDLQQRRIAMHEKRLEKSIGQNNNDLSDTENAEVNLLNQLAQSDQSMLNNMDLMDQVKYSTITLELYQAQQEKSEVVAIVKVPEPYRAGFGTRIGEAFSSGWMAVQEILIGLASIWWLFILAAMGYLVYRRTALKFAK